MAALNIKYVVITLALCTSNTYNMEQRITSIRCRIYSNEYRPPQQLHTNQPVRRVYVCHVCNSRFFNRIDFEIHNNLYHLNNPQLNTYE
jgi:hypothetical protein